MAYIQGFQRTIAQFMGLLTKTKISTGLTKKDKISTRLKKND